MADEEQAVQINVSSKMANTMVMAMFGVIGVGGFNLYSGTPDKITDNKTNHQLVSRVQALEVSVGAINAIVTENQKDLSSTHNIRWNLPDQVVFADLLQDNNPELDVPTPRNRQR